MSEWINVNDMLPGHNVNWCVVLTKNKSETTFALMASYDQKENEWEYFDSDKDYEKEMTVTHWMKLPDVTPE